MAYKYTKYCIHEQLGVMYLIVLSFMLIQNLKIIVLYQLVNNV